MVCANRNLIHDVVQEVDVGFTGGSKQHCHHPVVELAAQSEAQVLDVDVTANAAVRGVTQ